MEDQITEVNKMSPDQLGKHFIEKLKDKERLDQEMTKLNKEIAFLNTALVGKMEDRDLDSMVIDDFKLERVAEEQYSLDAEGNWDDEDGPFFKWLKEQKADGLIKKKLSVNNKTRDKFFKDWREEGKSLPDFVKISYWKRIKYNKSEVKRRVVDEI